MTRRSTGLFAALALAALSGLACGPGRQSAATQPMPKAFDPGLSDPKALEIADKVFAANGSVEAWNQAREIAWNVEIIVDDKPVFTGEHYWDRWNGRRKSIIKISNPTQNIHTMEDMFGDTEYGYVTAGGGYRQLARAEIPDAVKRSREKFDDHHYWLALAFKLKDPGVILKYVGERTQNDGSKLEEIEVSFQEGVGPSSGDKYYVLVNPQTYMIDSVEIEKEKTKDKGRIGYRYLDYTEINGIKLPQTMQNIGYEAEKIRFWEIRVSDLPDEEKYVPPVGGL